MSLFRTGFVAHRIAADARSAHQVLGLVRPPDAPAP